MRDYVTDRRRGARGALALLVALLVAAEPAMPPAGELTPEQIRRTILILESGGRGEDGEPVPEGAIINVPVASRQAQLPPTVAGPSGQPFQPAARPRQLVVVPEASNTAVITIPVAPPPPPPAPRPVLPLAGHIHLVVTPESDVPVSRQAPGGSPPGRESAAFPVSPEKREAKEAGKRLDSIPAPAPLPVPASASAERTTSPPASATSLTSPGPGPAPLELLPVGCVGCQSGLLSATLSPPRPGSHSAASWGGSPVPVTGPGAPEPIPGLNVGPGIRQLDSLPGPNGCCGDAPPCHPGRNPCYPCDNKGCLGRFCCALYECICCPDPCYEGKWYAQADAAFFCEAVRPVIQTKLRWDSGQGMIFPDRNEYFWARADSDGKGPSPRAPFRGETGLRYNNLVLITEGGTSAITLAVETPYRNLQAEQFGHAAGFSDIKLTTKTLLFDCELLQFALLMSTYIPSGNVRKGLGVGHMSLEPGGVVGIKLTPTTYMQMQVSEWIPLGGDESYAGAVLHYHASFNQVVWRPVPNVPLVATLEFAGYSFQDGHYTDPMLGSFQKSSGYTYAYGGGGLRLVVCDKIDFGMGGLFALTDQHFAREMYRMEFRVRW